MKRISRILTALLAALLLCTLTAPCALAERGIDPEAEGSIVLHMSYQGKPVTGGQLKLTMVGTVEQDDGSYYFRLLPELGGERLDQAALDRPGLADELAAKDAVGKLPGQSKGFDSKGEARFDENVKPGLYLLVQTVACPGYQKLKPILVSVPVYNAEKDSYDYQVDATVKPALEREAKPTPSPSPSPSPDPHLPQTGQLNWPVPAMAGLGLALVLLGLLLLGGRRKDRT